MQLGNNHTFPPPPPQSASPPPMGLTQSHAQAASPPPPPGSPSAPPGAPPDKPPTRADYMNLPQPVRYEELQREVYMSLKPDLFDGFRLDITKPLNPNFGLSHSVAMGTADIPTSPMPGAPTTKQSLSNYDFGATLGSEKGLLMGRMHNDGRTSARFKYDVTPYLALKC